MMDPKDREWTVAETHTLLDLIKDGGFLPGLMRKGYPNWDVFERLSVLLNRCNITVSMEQVKAHWLQLKKKFWKHKRMVDGSLGRASGLTVDFPFYEEMEQLLTSQRPVTSSKREADSSGLEAPLPLDSEDPGLSSTHQAEDVNEVQVVADAGLGLLRGFPGEGLLPSQYLQRCMRTLPSSSQDPNASERLQDCVQDLLRAAERLNDMSSFVTTYRSFQNMQAFSPRVSRARPVSQGLWSNGVSYP